MATATEPRRISAHEKARRVSAAHPLDAVLERAGVRLERAGERRRRALCPLHGESVPSFYADLDRQTFVCFGCGARGDVIDFVCASQGFGDPNDRASGAFAKALRFLGADEPGALDRVKPLPPPPPPPPPTDGERAAIAAAGAFYARGLAHAPHAIAYLESRGVPHASARRLGLGFGRPGLAAALKDAGAGVRDALAVGLLRERGEGQTGPPVRETFRGRITIPDFPPGGPVAWLSARALPGARSRIPYLNVKRPAKPLLGLSRVPEGAAAVLVVEGQFDWIAARCAGIEAVALLGGGDPGTLRDLRRFRRVYVATDADPGGDALAAKVADAVGDRAVRVAMPPGANDPGDLGRHGPDGLLALRTAVGEAAARARTAALPRAA